MRTNCNAAISPSHFSISRSRTIMAFCGSRHGFMAISVAMAILAITTVASGSSMCSGDLVYPFEAMCWEPARYFGQEVYELADRLLEAGSLAPEWDESNSTYYVRLADVGAQYKFEYWTSREYRAFVSHSDDVRIVNVESGLVLGWREEGENEWFLVEVPRDESSSLQFANYFGLPTPCLAIYPPTSCGVYTILNYQTSLGLTQYEEDDVIYFTLSNVSDAYPFRLHKVNTTVALA